MYIKQEETYIYFNNIKNLNKGIIHLDAERMTVKN